MTTLISLVDRLPDTEHREIVIELLREALTRAESGDVVAIGIVEVTPDGATRQSKSKSDNVNILLGGLLRLIHRINVEMDSK